MICIIKWNQLNFPEWQEYFNQIRPSNLLQSLTYTKVQYFVNKQKNRIGLIEIDGRPAGIVQMLEVSLGCKLIHAMIVDRGPLWFDGYGKNAHFKAFVKELNKQFPKRLGRMRRFIPEVEDTPQTRAVLKEGGFIPASNVPYETLMLDLTKSTEMLRKNLKKNWRGALKKAERNIERNNDVQIMWDDSGEQLPWLLTQYQIDKNSKGYNGPSVKLLKALGSAFAAEKAMLIGKAVIAGEPIGGILILCHGAGATYQVGWSGQKGREFGAHYLLLWQALAVLQEKGIKDFDLGGVNEDSAQGVKKFKEGMGARPLRLPGIYR